mgnify:FL=1
MVELALLDEPLLQVDDFEMRGAASYTIDTVLAFADDRDLFLFLGSDSLLELDRWRRWREIVDRCSLVVLPRPGYEVRIEELGGPLRLAAGQRRLHWAEHGGWAVSSTGLRRDLAASAGVPVGAEGAPSRPPPEEKLHPRVLQYIRKYGLYR